MVRYNSSPGISTLWMVFKILPKIAKFVIQFEVEEYYG